MGKILVAIMIVLVVLGVIFGSKNSIPNPNKYLKEKYPDIEFKYIKLVDEDSGWKKHSFSTPNNEIIVVNCVKNGCRDNYYNIYNKDKINDYVYNELKKVQELPTQYKFANVNNSRYFSNKVLLTTPIEEVRKLDDVYTISGPVIIFVKEDIKFSNNAFSTLKDIGFDVIVYRVSSSDYNKFNVDNRGYIYDYITSNEISTGTNSNYVGIKEDKLFPNQ